MLFSRLSLNRLSSGGLIDRSVPYSFSWNGSVLHGYRGDTLASALLANGEHLVGRSFKYHRPRGIVAAGADEPNAIVQVGLGARTIPNLRATQVELYDGLSARSVNCWPSLRFDIAAINSIWAGLLPAGFYYKTFMRPAGLWRFYEGFIRKAAGLGTAPQAPDPDHYDHMHAHCDVLVIGAGASGLAAALGAARSGARVILADEQAIIGGGIYQERTAIDGFAAPQWAAQVLDELSGCANVRLLLRTTVTGLYRDHFAIALERRHDHLPPGSGHGPRQRQWRIRAKRMIIAAGALERPLVFSNNDRPGVMLAGAVSEYLARFAVCPGRQTVVFTNNDSAYAAALALHGAGCSVRAVVDVRESVYSAAARAVRERGIEILNGHVVTDTGGTMRVREVKIMERTGDSVRRPVRIEPCDLLAVSGGWNPAVHLHSHYGGKVSFDDTSHTFVPLPMAGGPVSVGAAAGGFALDECLRDAYATGSRAGGGCGGSVPAFMLTPPLAAAAPLEAMWLVPGPTRPEELPKQFVDLQNDTSAADLKLAVREGYRSIEHVKRYTALGFGTDQGKLGNINGLGIVAEALKVAPATVGTTTFRPPYSPMTMGAVAGRHVGALLDPVRKTAMHEWHGAHGAQFENVGQWQRPWYYSKPGESMAQAVDRECLAVRRAAGMIDASTLGKIDVRGRDAAEFLDRIYTNGWKKLAVGRARYGIMLGEDGMVMDDGVCARLAEDRYFMTTTTGGAAHVLAWMERWRQTEWPDLEVFFTSVTDAWAIVAVAGPCARDVLGAVCQDIDLATRAFPFMSFREGTVAGVQARVFRVSFSGELAFEINVAADYGQKVWDAVFAAGEAYGITPYGTEAMHVLRAEKGFVIVGQDTDGSVTPGDLGMDWMVAKHKDFIGKRSLSRSDCLRTDRKQWVGLCTLDPEVVLPEGAQLVNEPFTRLPAPMVGHVTSSYRSATLGRAIALALVKGGRGRHGETIYASLADGRLVPARIGPAVFYDPRGIRLHG
ncbi:MAG: sarcosine oxidase subunit alpha family protein [Gammaproteobacteria bacterium]|nr:sarcosine oxidase subunit alpha family protein [Gammaproteobacteria bacterium]